MQVGLHRHQASLSRSTAEGYSKVETLAISELNEFIITAPTQVIHLSLIILKLHVWHHRYDSGHPICRILISYALESGQASRQIKGWCYIPCYGCTKKHSPFRSWSVLTTSRLIVRLSPSIASLTNVKAYQYHTLTLLIM